MRHVMIHEVLTNSLTTQGWQPKETVPQLPQQDAQKSWGRHLSCDGTADYLPSGTVGQRQPVTGQRKGHHLISVQRHLTKNRPGLPQKSSEKPCSEGEGDPRTPACSARGKKEKAKGPRCARKKKLNGVAAPPAFYKVVAATTVQSRS